MLFRSNGENWTKIISQGAIKLIAANQSLNIIYASEGQNIVNRSQDNGTNWTGIGDSSTLGLIETLYPSVYDNALYVGTHSNGIYYYDSTKWVKIPFFDSAEYNTIMGIIMDSSKYLYVGTATKGVFRTNDLGKTWQEVNYGISRFIKTFATNKNSEIFAGTGSQGVYKKLNIVTNVKDVKNVIPEQFTLSQNYPNPFNPSTIISFQLSARSRVTLKVYDILGREVSILVNDEKPAGNYKIHFYASNLSSGVYFYRLSAVGKGINFVKTKKMILIK